MTSTATMFADEEKCWSLHCHGNLDQTESHYSANLCKAETRLMAPSTELL